MFTGDDGVERCYSWHSNDPIRTFREDAKGAKAQDNIDLFTIFECNGDWEQAQAKLTGEMPKTERFHSSTADLGLDDLEESVRSARRERQRQENEEIGDKLPEISTLPTIHTVEGMLGGEQHLERYSAQVEAAISMVLDSHAGSA